MKRSGWALFARISALVWLLALGLIGHAQQIAPQPLQASGVLVFERAEFTQAASVTPPREATWREVALPDSWRKRSQTRQNYGWYRLAFSADALTVAADDLTPYAIYLSRITNNAEFFLNGTTFAISGRTGPDPEESWNTAQFYIIPSTLVKPGVNELLIRLHPDQYARPGIAQVFLGDAKALKARFDRRYFVQTAGPQMISVLLVVMAAFSITIWVNRRRELMFLFFGLMAVAAAFRLFPYYLRDTPLWLALLAVPALCWLEAMMLVFSLHYAAAPMPRLERAIIWVAALMSLATFLVAPFGYGAYSLLMGVTYLVLGIAGIPLAGVVIHQLLKNRSYANIFMAVALVANVLIGIYDLLNYQEYFSFDSLYLQPWGLPLVLISMAGLLAQRFITTITSYELLNATLATRISEREHELAASHARERTLDTQRAAAEERQRLMRDMHDGIGSFLMSTLALARHRPMSQSDFEHVLQDCIDELKLTIDSMEPVESDLLVVLGNLRYRLEPRLNAAGITLEWAVQDLPQLSYLDHENVRSILHIVQEALTNTLKHAKASRITISTGVDFPSQRVLVRLTDDGLGRPTDARAGRGLGNMRARAAKLGGEVDIIDLQGGGTCVNLYLPLR